MINKILKLLALAYFFAGIIFFAGCSDEGYHEPIDEPEETIVDNPTDDDDNDDPDEGDDDDKPDDPDKPSTPNFSTTQTVTFYMNYNVTNATSITFDAYPVYPLDANNNLLSGLYSVAGGIYDPNKSSFTRVIPLYVKELYVYSLNPKVPLLSHAKIIDGVASFKAVK